MLSMFLLLAFTSLGHECQDLLSPCNGKHVSTDKTSVCTLIQKSFGETEPMSTPREKSPLPEKIFPEEYRTNDTTSHRTACPTHYKQAIPAPVEDILFHISTVQRERQSAWIPSFCSTCTGELIFDSLYAKSI